MPEHTASKATIPDQTVKVTFTDPSAFTFNPESVIMTAAGKIILLRDPETAGWTFVSVNGLPSGFTWRLDGNGSSIVIDDQHTSLISVHYTVTVQDQSGTHTSEDPVATTLPMIVNQ